MAARVTKRDVERLVAEIQLYLETVDTFREVGLEPRWQAEATPAGRKRRGSSKSRKGG
jgi:hypothetical protein